MALEKLDIEKIREQFAKICETEKGDLDNRREDAKKLCDARHSLALKEWEGQAVAFVAADGGDNRIRLDSLSDTGPAVVELVRVVDSEGNGAMEPFAGASDRHNFGKLEVVEKLCMALGCEKVSDLSPYLGRVMELGGKRRSRSEQMRAYREIVEWAVFYELLKTCKINTLVVRDGALRTRFFYPDIFRKFDHKIRKIISEHKSDRDIDVYCVGVAKQTRVLNWLHLAISMEEVFGRGAQYIAVPDEIIRKFYNDSRWVDTMEMADGEYHSLAKMYLVKFGEHPLDSVWPVDIATWQEAEADKILGYLARDARPGFPIPDFPMCIQKAHEYAKIGGIEMAYLQELLFDEMESSMSKADSEKILRVRYLMEDVSARRYSK